MFMTHLTLLPNRLVHFESFEVYFWKRISKNFSILVVLGLFYRLFIFLLITNCIVLTKIFIIS